jgi:fumarate reductase subunit D
MEAGSASSEAGYPGAAVAGAVLATLFFPLIALIAALLLQGGQVDPRKRSQLRTWAWASGGLMVLDVLFVVLAVSAWSGT